MRSFYLKRIEKTLQHNNMLSTTLSRKLTAARRDANLAQVREDPSCNILLGSIQAAGVGIDLRCAQHVYLMVSYSCGSNREERLI